MIYLQVIIKSGCYTCQSGKSVCALNYSAYKYILFGVQRYSLNMNYFLFLS